CNSRRDPMNPHFSDAQWRTYDVQRKHGSGGNLTGSAKMHRTLEAVYENGVLRPLQPLEGIAEHRQVTITVTVQEDPSGLDACIGSLPDEDAREIERIID